MIWRLFLLVLSLGLPAWGWTDLHEAHGPAGLAVMLAAGLVVVPNILLWLLVFLPSMLPDLLVPSHLRARYRHEHGRRYTGRDGRVHEADSSKIPEKLRHVTYFADRHRCVMSRLWRRRACEGVLCWDHIRPWAGGYRTCLRNGMTLCWYHNEVKSNYSRDPDGYEHYHGSPRNKYLARRILHAELMHRLNPYRGMRMAWAIGSR
jgi:hypothetical protein